jgi:hypothetical protein
MNVTLATRPLGVHMVTKLGKSFTLTLTLSLFINSVHLNQVSVTYLHPPSSPRCALPAELLCWLPDLHAARLPCLEVATQSGSQTSPVPHPPAACSPSVIAVALCLVYGPVDCSYNVKVEWAALAYQQEVTQANPGHSSRVCVFVCASYVCV